MIQIKKKNTVFNVSGIFSENWFKNAISNGDWEQYTFDIIDRYSDNDKIYLDIGSWIGPTVLYAADKYKKIYCYEPDPVAIDRLNKNLSVNNFKNITLIKEALSNETGKSKFGGNKKLGNSMSTLLVNDSNFIENGGEVEYLDKTDRATDIIEVNTITFDESCKKYNIDVNNIGLVKIDIEGGEYFVIPAMEDFLRKCKPVLYISLHWVFLKKEQIISILNILFDIYNSCYNIDKFKVDTNDVINKKLQSLVFRET